MAAIGIKLRNARERLGLTQRDLALQAFQDADFQSLISRYETGVVEPSISTLRRLAPVLNLSLGDFGEEKIAGVRK